MENVDAMPIPVASLAEKPRRPLGTLGRTLALFRLELAESLRSRWLLLAAVAYAAGLGAFVWLGLRESSVLGFTGLSRVVLGICNATVVILPLVALVATSQSITRSRTVGHLELLLTQPVRRGEWFAALLAARSLTLLAPLALLLAAMLLLEPLLQQSDPTLLPMTLHALAVAASLLAAFVGLGTLVSAVSKTPERAVVLALLVWLATATLHDFALIGLLLQWRVPTPLVFGLAALNPVEAARLAVLSAVDPELALLGPVGFWLANQLGPLWTYLAGLLWPLAVGLGAAGIASAIVKRRDAVG